MLLIRGLGIVTLTVAVAVQLRKAIAIVVIVAVIDERTRVWAQNNQQAIVEVMQVFAKEGHELADVKFGGVVLVLVHPLKRRPLTRKPKARIERETATRRTTNTTADLRCEMQLTGRKLAVGPRPARDGTRAAAEPVPEGFHRWATQHGNRLCRETHGNEAEGAKIRSKFANEVDVETAARRESRMVAETPFAVQIVCTGEGQMGTTDPGR